MAQGTSMSKFGFLALKLIELALVKEGRSATCTVLTVEVVPYQLSRLYHTDCRDFVIFFGIIGVGVVVGI